MEVGVIICNEPVKRYQVMACYVIDMVYLAMGPGTGGLPCMNLYFPTPGYLRIPSYPFGEGNLIWN